MSKLESLPQTRQRRHFGRRKGPSLSAHQAKLMENLLPQLELVLQPGRDPKEYFRGAMSEVWLEVGFGGGEHLVWQAEAYPQVGMIGAEPYVAGMAKLLARIATREGLSNIRLYREDASDIIAALPAASLARIFVLFPDPWPKTRHHKRRFIQTPMLDELARVLRRGGELRFATDDAGYLVWTLERLTAHRAFAWMAEGAGDWRSRTPDWPQTRYEAKALHGVPVFLRFQRVA